MIGYVVVTHGESTGQRWSGPGRHCILRILCSWWRACLECLHFTSLICTFSNVSHSFSPSCCSTVEDVCRCVWSRGQRCPANPAVLLASCHGGDQEPDCGMLCPLKWTKPTHASDLDKEIKWFSVLSNTHTNVDAKTQVICALFCL